MSQPRLHEQPIDRCPDVLEYGFVYELAAGAVYWVAFRQQSVEIEPFIEHAETFGSRAWQPRCEK